MRGIVFTDLHLEAGGHLGSVDADYESSRLRDAERILGEILAVDHDFVIFGGDMARTATPRPVAYQVLQRALQTTSKPVLLMLGNHDWNGSRFTCLHAAAEGLLHVNVVTRPKVVKVGRMQIGLLPWTPPNRLFDAARHDPRAMNAAVAERLVGAAHALGRQTNADEPSILVGHWMLRESSAGSVSALDLPEPLVPVDDLESGPWDAILFGHNHVHQKLGTRTWHIGPPMRTSFGESDHQTGWVQVALHEDGTDDVTVTLVPTDDVRVVRWDVAAEEVFKDPPRPKCKGAIVRAKISGDEEDVRALVAQQYVATLKDDLLADGAVRVMVQMDVRRERRVRSDLSVDTSPDTALARWLEANEVAEGLRGQVQAVANEIMKEAAS